MKKRLRLIFVAFCISFAMMAALSLFALKQFSSLVEYGDQVDDTYELISQLYRLENMSKEADVKERNFMITRDSTFHAELDDLYRQITLAKDNLKNYINKDSVQYKNLIILSALLVDKRDNSRLNLAYIDTAKSTENSPYFLKDKKIRTETTDYMDKMRMRAHEMLSHRSQTKIYYQEITFSTIRSLLSVFAFVTLALFFFMIRELKRRMRYQDELQLKVADLKRSHAELEQIAYAVSHDLQEPLRKIQIFSNRLLYVRKHDMDDESRDTLERINSSAGRMHELIDDLMNLTSLVKEEHMDQIDLNETMLQVLEDLESRIEEKEATIQTEALPVIYGHNRQIQLLFRSLLDNSLKFSRDTTLPFISIRYDRVNGSELKEYNIASPEQKNYYRITIADNGIGFEDKFIKKMFQIFQSLHNKQSEYSGKGIGLAICQRVMVNHGGYILAHGRPNVGATFKLYFPIKE